MCPVSAVAVHPVEPEVRYATAHIGPIGRFGRFMAPHRKSVALSWLLLVIGLGVFAPRVETALSGAGWEATGSESVQARQQIHKNFNGLGSYAQVVVVHSPDRTVSDPTFRRVLRRAEAKLKGDPAVTTVVPPRAGVSISADRHTAVIQAGAARNSNEMVRAADRLKGPLAKLGSARVQVSLTGA